MKTIVVIILGLMLLYLGSQIIGKPARVEVEAPQEIQQPIQQPIQPRTVAPEIKPPEEEYVMVITEEVIEEEVEE